VDDAAALHAYLAEPVVYNYEPGDPITFEEAQALVLERSQGTDFWAVALKESNLLVGHLYFNPVEPAELGVWELGYIFNPRYQHQGYAAEAAGALVDFAFSHLNAHRIVALCNPLNTASWKLLERIGFTREGTLRRNIFFRRDANGSPLWTDTYVYARLSTDAG
jgi:ribosomal-protein-alanine N-acetyltransferase